LQVVKLTSKNEYENVEVVENKLSERFSERDTWSDINQLVKNKIFRVNEKNPQETIEDLDFRAVTVMTQNEDDLGSDFDMKDIDIITDPKPTKEPASYEDMRSVFNLILATDKKFENKLKTLKVKFQSSTKKPDEVSEEVHNIRPNQEEIHLEDQKLQLESIKMDPDGPDYVTKPPKFMDSEPTQSMQAGSTQATTQFSYTQATNQFGNTQTTTQVGYRVQGNDPFPQINTHEDYLSNFLSKKHSSISIQDLEGGRKFHISEEVMQFLNDQWEDDDQ